MRANLLIAAAPLALLAACGDSTPVEEVEPEPMPTADVPVTVELPEIPIDSVITIDYPGAYVQGDTRLELNENMTYVLTRPDGSTISGTYAELEESNRIRLESFDGPEPAWFSIGTGAIYQLEDENVPYNQITVEGEFRRESESGVPLAPLATPTATATAESDAAAE